MAQTTTLIQLQNNLQFPNQIQVAPWQMPGVKFRPTAKEIFTYFLPQKILFGSSSFPPSHYSYTQYVDLYGNLSPKELFLDSQETDFYCFSSLKSHNGSKKRVARVAGGGTWDEDGSKKQYIDDGIYVGTMKSLKFKFSKDNVDKDDGCTSWILHEYAIDKNYLVEYHNAPSDINVDKIRFNHIHKIIRDDENNRGQKRKGDFHLLSQQTINKKPVVSGHPSKAFSGYPETTTPPVSALETTAGADYDEASHCFYDEIDLSDLFDFSGYPSKAFSEYTETTTAQISALETTTSQCFDDEIDLSDLFDFSEANSISTEDILLEAPSAHQDVHHSESHLLEANHNINNNYEIFINNTYNNTNDDYTSSNLESVLGSIKYGEDEDELHWRHQTAATYVS